MLINPMVDKFISDYIETALWSTVEGDAPLDYNYSISELAPETLASMKIDCLDFIGQVEALGFEFETDHAGHDFWLTRCGHGAGFWDGDYPTHGDTLTALSTAMGNIDLYVGDDGMIYSA
jgi:hypothetical protein